jgi:hypothetical protein
MGQPIPMVMLPSQEGVMTQENKLVKIHHKLKETTKVVIKAIKILILQSIKTMKIKMIVQSKQEQSSLTQEFINPFNGTILLIAYWETYNKG